MIDQQATSPILHGGNQLAIRKRLGLGAQPLLDFSAPLNALGPPRGVVEAVRAASESIDRYPEPDSRRLVERLAAYHDIPSDRIIVGAGTTELISLIGQVMRESERVASHLVEPCYGEYRRTSAQHGLDLKVWPGPVLGWEQDAVPVGASGVFWTGHPNNPTGRAWDRVRLLDLIDGSSDLLTVVDEAYLAFFPDQGARTLVSAAASRENVVVLRSMTKIYALPGLRIGYAVASPERIAELRRAQQPWTVTTAAEAAALVALDDDEYVQRSVELIQTEAGRLIEHLWDLPGIRPAWPSRQRPATAPPLPNFVLVSLFDTPWNSNQLQDALARQGILARECSNYRGLEPGATITGCAHPFETRGHLRFCVHRPAENDRLLATLARILASAPPA